ncbi:MAG: class I SAM-dependent methyltransferase, partial [Desulfobulbaceae bacterium]|nr:class I SAM-dependent methyltransferase [Desulfobulbaceae bacterium]
PDPREKMWMLPEINRTARQLFAPIAADYGFWSRLLSFWQDPRWRRSMIRGLRLPPNSRILDVAAGTGEVTRLLQQEGHQVISLDQSREMLRRAADGGAVAALGRAEELPFAGESFDALTFTYLLRYVEDPLSCMRELARVVRPGGSIGMVEFGRPRGLWGALWRFYTRNCLPLAGKYIGHGWEQVGTFLGPNIDAFWRRFPGDGLIELWEEAGLDRVERTNMSLGGGIFMTGRKK